MKRILLTVLFVLTLVCQVCGATYYVSTSGSDSNDGLSTGAPWKTIAKVNGSSFSAGDIISLNGGNIWYETLILPANIATVNSYGTGQAILSGAIDCSGLPVGTPSEIITNGDAETGNTSGWTVTGNGTATADDTDKYAGTYSFKLVWGTSGNQRFDQAVTLEANTLYNFSFWQKKTSGSDCAVLIFTGSTYLQNDLISYGGANALTGVSITSGSWTKRSINFFSAAAGTYTIRFQQGSASTCWLDNVTLKKVQWTLVSGTEYSVNIFQNRILSATKSLFMDSTTATLTGVSYYNGSALTLGTAGALTNGQCGYDSTNFTYNVNIGGSPSGLDIKIPWRGMNIHLNGKSSVTINNLDLRYSSTDDGTNVCGAIVAEDTASTSVVIQNCVMLNHWNSAVRGDTAAHTSWVINNNTISNIWNGRAYGSNGRGTSLYLNTGMTSVIAKYNFINNCYVGILCESPGGSVYGNLLTNIYVNGIDHQSSTSANPITVNNNSIYHTPLWASGHGISCQIAGHGAIIKNNVIYTNVTAGATGQCLTVSNSNNVQFNNNALFATGAGTAQIASLAYTGQDAGLLKNYTTADWARYLTDLDSMKSNATVVWTNNGTLGNAAMLAGVMANPKYTNGSGAYSLAADFKLLPGSPCINTGLVGALPATDYEGKVWISPDIGAYAFRNTGFFSF